METSPVDPQVEEHFREAVESGLLDRAAQLRHAADSLYLRMLVGEVPVSETNRRLREATSLLLGDNPDADAEDPY